VSFMIPQNSSGLQRCRSFDIFFGASFQCEPPCARRRSPEPRSVSTRRTMDPSHTDTRDRVVAMDIIPPTQVPTRPAKAKRSARANDVNGTTASGNASDAPRDRPGAPLAQRPPAILATNPSTNPTRVTGDTASPAAAAPATPPSASCTTSVVNVGNGGARNNSLPPPRPASNPLGPTIASDLAPALGRLARVLQDKRNVATTVRERLPGMPANQAFEPGVVERDIARLTMDTHKSIDPLHEDVKVPTLMFVSPVTDREAKHVDNPFMMPVGIKTAAALKKRDALADMLLRIDYTFLTKEGAPKPVTAEDVFENGHRSFDIVIDDNQISGLYSIAVFSEYVDQLAEAFRKGLFGHFFCPGLPRDEPADALRFAIAVDKTRGRVQIMQSEVIFELWHQHLVSSAYFITDPRAFKGQYVYLCTCVSQSHLAWCLDNSVTLLGDAQFETFRHDPVQGVNTFFLSGAMSVTDANLRIKPGLAGLLRLKASQVNFFKAADLVSKNVVVMRVETSDDAATVAQVNALMSRGILLSTTKPGKTSITYAPSHVGTPYKVASSLDELQKLVGHVIMKTPVSTSDPELGEEPECVRAAPGTNNPRVAELLAIVAAGPPATEESQNTRRRRVSVAPPGSAAASGSATAATATAATATASLASASAPAPAHAPTPALDLAPAPAPAPAAPAPSPAPAPASAAELAPAPPPHGALVRVKRSVTTPAYEWGSVTHDSIGVFIGLAMDGDWLIDFPGCTEWRGIGQELEVVDARVLPPHVLPPPVTAGGTEQAMELEGEEGGVSADDDELEDELSGEEGMLFILEHFFALKRFARLWRKRRALQSPALATATSPYSPVTLGASTVPLSQNKKTRTSEVHLDETPSRGPTAAVASLEDALGDVRFERQGCRGGSVILCDEQGTRDPLASMLTSYGDEVVGISVLRTELSRDSATLHGCDHGTRLPRAASQHERRDGESSRDGGCVDMSSPLQGAGCTVSPPYACVGIQMSTLAGGDEGTACHHDFGRYGQQDMRSHSVGVWWDHAPHLSLPWTCTAIWHGFRGRRFASVHCPRRRRRSLEGALTAPVRYDASTRRATLLLIGFRSWLSTSPPFLTTCRAPYRQDAVMASRKFAIWLSVHGSRLRRVPLSLDFNAFTRRAASAGPRTRSALHATALWKAQTRAGDTGCASSGASAARPATRCRIPAELWSSPRHHRRHSGVRLRILLRTLWALREPLGLPSEGLPLPPYS
jgi:hypothetical protein